MRMHSLQLALVATVLATTGLVAQASPLAVPGQDAPAQTRPRGGGDRYKDLNLSADQKTKLDALLQEERGQRGPGRDQQAPPSDADRKAMESRRADLDAKVKGILTPEQYAKYQTQRPQGGPGKGVQRPLREE